MCAKGEILSSGICASVTGRQRDVLSVPFSEHGGSIWQPRQVTVDRVGLWLSGRAPGWYAERARVSPWHLQIKGSGSRQCERAPPVTLVSSCRVGSIDLGRPSI